MNGNRDFEEFARTINDIDNMLPKGRTRCFDIGYMGGCGVNCAAFVDGECTEPQEIEASEIIDEYGEQEAIEIMVKYSCYGIKEKGND